MPDDDLTIAEAAAALGIHESVVRRAIQRGAMKARRIGQRVLVVSRDEVAAYDTNRKERPAPPGQGDPKRRPGPKPPAQGEGNRDDAE